MSGQAYPRHKIGQGTLRSLALTQLFVGCQDKPTPDIYRTWALIRLAKGRSLSLSQALDSVVLRVAKKLSTLIRLVKGRSLSLSQALDSAVLRVAKNYQPSIHWFAAMQLPQLFFYIVTGDV